MTAEIFITSAAIFGLHETVQPGMIFGRVGDWVESFFRRQDLIGKVVSWFSMPVIACPICMASIWGTVGYLLQVPDPNLIDWAIFVLAVAGVNAILLKLTT